jgi:hypothetical protein
MSFLQTEEAPPVAARAARRRLPIYGCVGIALVIVSWVLSWARIEPFFRYTFFPLWFGYITTMDALVYWRRRTSLYTRGGWKVLQLFIFSSLFWWIFEAANVPVQNWHYILDQRYSLLAYIALASLDFSTVLPAVLETAEFVSSFRWFQPKLVPADPGPLAPLWVRLSVFGTGIVSCVAPIFWPAQTFYLIWVALVFLLDPINNTLRRKSSLGHAFAGDWHFFLMLPLSGLICGFFWEMWNWLALPKWYYTVPYVGFWKIFEMPLLGYTGYLPFALELFAMYQTLLLLTRQRHDGLEF